MLKTLLSAAISPMERRWGYDASYVRMLIRVRPWSALKFALVSGMANRRDVPGEALAAAGLVGTLAEDCGPCAQLGVDMAIAGGVSADVLRAILAGDRGGMGDTARLAYDFAQAVLAHAPEADDLRDEIVRRWGERGLAALALTITTARMYPTLKYGLGHGKACMKMTVAGAPAPFVRAPARPVAVAAE